MLGCNSSSSLPLLNRKQLKKSFSCHSVENKVWSKPKVTFSMLPPTSCSSTPQARKRKWFRKSWASETGNGLCFYLATSCPGGEEQTAAVHSFSQWKWNEGDMCSSWEHELGPVPGTRRSLIFSLSAHSMLISTEETSFSFLRPKRRSKCWLTSLARLTFPSWPFSRAASCPSLSWRNSFDKVLGPVWKSLPPCTPKQN